MTIQEQITKELEKLPEPLLQEILDFVQFLQTKQQQKQNLETAIMSESSLQKDWLKPEEDAAWQDL
jgi:mRNA-degrading endonuclease RelE of RelBE toxin-antitoxin system